MKRYSMALWVREFGDKANEIGNAKIVAITAESEKEARLRALERANSFRLQAMKIIVYSVRVIAERGK